MMKVTFEIISALELSPIFKIIIILIGSADFFAGMKEAYVFGFLYAVSLMFFGFYMNELGSIISGVVALAAFLLGITRKTWSA